MYTVGRLSGIVAFGKVVTFDIRGLTQPFFCDFDGRNDAAMVTDFRHQEAKWETKSLLANHPSINTRFHYHYIANRKFW